MSSYFAIFLVFLSMIAGIQCADDSNFLGDVLRRNFKRLLSDEIETRSTEPTAEETTPNVPTSSATIPSVDNDSSTIPSVVNTSSTTPSVVNTSSTIPSVDTTFNTTPSVVNTSSTIPSVVNTFSTIPSVVNISTTIPTPTTAPSVGTPSTTTTLPPTLPQMEIQKDPVSVNSIGTLHSAYGERIENGQCWHYEFRMQMKPNAPTSSYFNHPTCHRSKCEGSRFDSTRVSCDQVFPGYENLLKQTSG